MDEATAQSEQRSRRRARRRELRECARSKEECARFKRERDILQKELQLARQKEEDQAEKCYQYAQGYDSKTEEYLFFTKHAAKSGHAPAQYELGIIYEYGGYGIPTNEKLALEWYKKSADQKWEPAMCWIEDWLEKNGISAEALELRLDEPSQAQTAGTLDVKLRPDEPPPAGDAKTLTATQISTVETEKPGKRKREEEECIPGPPSLKRSKSLHPKASGQ